MVNKGKLHTFSINYTSEIDGKDYIGQFTCRKQSILDQTRITKKKSDLCGGMYCVRDLEGNPTGQGIDEYSESFGFALATLQTVLVSKPEWWDLDSISDQELIFKVFSEVSDFENSFRRRGRSQNRDEGNNGSSEEGSEKEHKETVNDSLPKKVVDEQVQAALDA